MDQFELSLLEISFEELKKENQELQKEVSKLRGTATMYEESHHKCIDAGIGEISYSISGSIDIIELMQELEKVIKNNGVRDTIRILAMSV